MPSISRKGQQMPESPIRKLVPYAEAAKKRGVNVIHLNIGQPDIKTPEIAMEAVKNADIKVLEYSRTEGSEEYRTKIAAYYAKQQIDVQPEDLVLDIGAGLGYSSAVMAMIAALTGVQCTLPRVEGVGGADVSMVSGKVVILGGSDYACFAAEGLAALGSQVSLISTNNNVNVKNKNGT